MDERSKPTENENQLGEMTSYRQRNGIRTYVFNQLGDLPHHVRDEAVAAVGMVGSMPDLSPAADLIQLHEPPADLEPTTER